MAERRYQQGQVQYLGNAGQVAVLAQRTSDGHTAAVDASGAIVLMDGNVSATRQVGNGFALVSTGAPGIQVLHENRPLGRTDNKGYLLVSNLVPYAGNLISVDTLDLPADTRLTATSQSVVPRAMAGVLVRFPVEKYTAASVIVHDASGKPFPPGIRVVDMHSGRATVMGYDGIVFIDALRASNRLGIGEDSAPCEISFAWAPENNLGVIGPLICSPSKGLP